MKKLLLFLGLLGLASYSLADEVNVYTSRQGFLMDPIFDAFTEKTGVKVNSLYVPKGIAEKIAKEGKNTEADVMLSTDIGQIMALKSKGLAVPVDSRELRDRIPAAYRDENGEWFGVSLRARVIYASKERVPLGTVKNYEDLVDPQFKGKICIRSGKHPYNVALLSSLILHAGEKAARGWLEGVKANLARKPQGNDRAQVKAIYAGECDFSLGNSYYYGKMKFNEKEPEQRKWGRFGLSRHAEPRREGNPRQPEHDGAGQGRRKRRSSEKADGVHGKQGGANPLRRTQPRVPRPRRRAESGVVRRIHREFRQFQKRLPVPRQDWSDGRPIGENRRSNQVRLLTPHPAGTFSHVKTP